MDFRVFLEVFLKTLTKYFKDFITHVIVTAQQKFNL